MLKAKLENETIITEGEVQEKVLIDISILKEIKFGIMQAIGDADGLDGNDGLALIESINKALGLEMRDFTLPDGTKWDQE